MTIKILTAIHPGCSHSAVLERAKGFAARHGIDVHLYSSIYDEHLASVKFLSSPLLDEYRRSMVAKQESVLSEIADELGSLGVTCEIEVDWHHPAGVGIVAAAQSCKADMILMSTKRHNQLSRLIMRNLDWEVLRTAHVPILLVHNTSLRAYKTVLAAVDPTHMQDEPAELDENILEGAQRLASWFNGNVHIAHAFPSANTRLEAEYIPPLELTEQWRSQHEQAVHKLADKYSIPESRQHMLDEFPVQAIPDIASEISADLVVIGVVSRSFLKRLWIGDTAESLLDRLECDILTTPPIQNGKCHT